MKYIFETGEIFEGTPKELGELMKIMGKNFKSSNTEDFHDNMVSEDENGLLPLPRDFISRVLTRRPMSDGQKKLLSLICLAKNNGIFGYEIVKKFKYTQAQFRGVMGAFGRRISSTKGFSQDFKPFFSWEWDEKSNSYRYWFEDYIREIIEDFLSEKGK